MIAHRFQVDLKQRQVHSRKNFLLVSQELPVSFSLLQPLAKVPGCVSNTKLVSDTENMQ